MAEQGPTRLAELQRLAEQVGERASALLRQFTRHEICVESLREGLRPLQAESLVATYWDVLTTERAGAACHEVLLIVSSLCADLEHQMRLYGETSLWDDREQLERALQRLRDQSPTLPTRA